MSTHVRLKYYAISENLFKKPGISNSCAGRIEQDKVASIYVPALGSSEGHETPANLSKKLLRSKD